MILVCLVLSQSQQVADGVIAEKEGVELKIAPETQKLNWSVSTSSITSYINVPLPNEFVTGVSSLSKQEAQHVTIDR